MSSKIIFDDGKEVTLSKETTERLREDLITPEFVDIRSHFRISKRKSSCNPIVMGIKKYGFIPEPFNNMPEEYRFVLLDKEKAQETVNVLQKMIDNLN